jgi:hypothetical protein
VGRSESEHCEVSEDAAVNGRLMVGCVRLALLIEQFDLIACTIRGESLHGFCPAAVRLCRMCSATVLYTRERNDQRGSAAQLV